MSWSYILFGIVLGIIIIKTLISTVFGDIDIDFDVDGDIDFDVSSVLSFKGILHFLLGFSSYLSILNYFYKINVFVWYHYAIGFLVGIVFMFGLYFIYKLTKKLDHYNNNIPNIDGCKGTILAAYKNGTFDVLVKTYSGTIKYNLPKYNKKMNFNIGDECIIRRINNIYFLVTIN